jgi:hypothetical protein
VVVIVVNGPAQETSVAAMHNKNRRLMFPLLSGKSEYPMDDASQHNRSKHHCKYLFLLTIFNSTYMAPALL